MTLEFILAVKMAATTPQRIRKEFVEAVLASSASTSGCSDFQLPLNGIKSMNTLTGRGHRPCHAMLSGSTVKADAIGAKIDGVVEDPENYEPGEPHPSTEAIETLKGILEQVERGGAQLPKTDVSTYYGEVDATWRKDNRMLRLISYSDGRSPQLYFCTDQGEALTRGKTIDPATSEDLAEKLAWLVG